MGEPTPKTTLAEGRYLRFVRLGRWEFVERINVTGIVGIVAVTAGGKLLLTEQVRPPVGGSVVELPAGLAGDVRGAEDEALAEAARRELEEETGYRAERLTVLASGTVSAGISGEELTLMLAENLTRVGPGGGDAGEDIRVHEVALAEVEGFLERRIAAGARVDLKLYAGLYFLDRRRGAGAEAE